MEVQLADFIYTYPAQDQPGLQTIITAKREFYELASSVTEPVPASGYLYKHQELIKRFMIPYDRLLLFHRAGTGKTCTVFGSAETLKEGILRATTNFIEDYIKPRRTNIRKIYILTRGDVLINELKRQLVCVCTNGTYLTNQITNATSEQQQKANVTRAVSPYYVIMGYTSFTNELKRHNLTDQQLKEEYSDTMFIVDEVQNIRVDHTTTTEEEARNNYAILHRLFHLIERSKIILASATPMVNDVSEIRDVMNLILPLDQQLGDYHYTDPRLEDLEPYFRGKVSYVRELDTGIIPRFVGQTMGGFYEVDGQQVPSQFIIYRSEMIDIQLDGYLRAKTSDGKDTFYSKSRMASNFVFPDGTYSKEDFSRWTVKRGPDVYDPVPDLEDWILYQLDSLSSKLKTLIDIAMYQPGSTFIYCDYKDAGGAAVVGMVLRTLGVDQFLDTASPFTSSGPEGVKPYCSTGPQSGRSIKIEPRLRFAMITSETTPAKTTNILDLFNSYENRHGDYLKILVGSPIAKVGLNLANVTQIHLFGPPWNQSHLYQSISRGIRTTSHVALLAEKRAELLSQGLDPSSARVEVSIYQHASVIGDEPTTDLYLYQLAESKDIPIRRMERIMRQVAIDCQIHYQRNVRSTDKDYSADCDYDICAYQCVDPAPDEQLKAQEIQSYNTLYSSANITPIETTIKILLTNLSQVDLDQVYQYLENYSPAEILLALEQIIHAKTLVVDRYGFESFIQLEGNTLYLQRDYPLGQGSKTAAYYVDRLFGINKLDITQYAVSLELPNQQQLIDYLLTLDPNSPTFDGLVQGLPLPVKINLVEKAYIDYVNYDSPWASKIMTLFQNYIYWFPEPTESIRRLMSLLTSRITKSGKPKSRKISRDVLERTVSSHSGGTGETVYLHTLYSQSYDQTSYAVVSRFIHAEGKIRLYKPSEGIGFRDATEAETPVYAELVQRELSQKIGSYDQYNIYGMVLSDGSFRIRDKSTENSRAAKSDARKINRGRICRSWRKPDLIDVMYQLGIEPPTVIDTGMTDDQAYMFLQTKLKETSRVKLNELSSDKLQFFARWYLESMPVESGICPYIQSFLAERQMLFVA